MKLSLPNPCAEAKPVSMTPVTSSRENQSACRVT